MEPNLSVDRVGVALLVALAVVVTPGILLAAIWQLTDGFTLAQTSSFELGLAALSGLLVLFIIRLTLRELGGALGVEIDEHGIRKGKSRKHGFELRWDEVETLDAPAFGLLDIGGKGQTLRLRTYLYDDRLALLETIARRTGKQVPEMGHSF